jgi:hypothetical protein
MRLRLEKFGRIELEAEGFRLALSVRWSYKLRLRGYCPVNVCCCVGLAPHNNRTTSSEHSAGRNRPDSQGQKMDPLSNTPPDWLAAPKLPSAIRSRPRLRATGRGYQTNQKSKLRRNALVWTSCSGTVPLGSPDVSHRRLAPLRKFGKRVVCLTP